jgi:hypothetical protein
MRMISHVRLRAPNRYDTEPSVMTVIRNWQFRYVLDTQILESHDGHENGHEKSMVFQGTIAVHAGQRGPRASIRSLRFGIFTSDLTVCQEDIRM